MLDPMSRRSIWGHEKLSSSPSAPASWQSRASRCQFCSSLSLPEPAMIEAMRTRSGKACLMRRIRGSHQSSVLSEMSSQFQDECSAEPGRFFIETQESSGDVRMNLALAPTTLATGWSPIVLVTTPAHPASKARRMLLSDSVGGAEASRKGFAKSSPVKLTDRVADMSEASVNDRRFTPVLPLRRPGSDGNVGRATHASSNTNRPYGREGA